MINAKCRMLNDLTVARPCGIFTRLSLIFVTRMQQARLILKRTFFLPDLRVKGKLSLLKVNVKNRVLNKKILDFSRK